MTLGSPFAQITSMQIDLNSDLGEDCGHDQELMPLVTSANVGCGFHAGDAETTFATLALAVEHRVQVGAHPGFPDRINFGRTELPWDPEKVYHECIYQVGALLALAQAAHCEVRYLKPHGALYNMACRDAAYARPVVHAARMFGLALMGLPRSQLASCAQGLVPFIAEGFADRRYRPDGSLTPRTEPDAFVTDPEEAVGQGLSLLREQGIQTLCVHGDNPQALDFIKALRLALARRDCLVQAFRVDRQ